MDWPGATVMTFGSSAWTRVIQMRLDVAIKTVEARTNPQTAGPVDSEAEG